MRSFFIFLLPVFLLCTVNRSWGQTNPATDAAYQKVVRETNVKRLQQLAQQAQEDFRINKARALDSAKKYGWEIKKVLPDSSVMELMSLDEKGKPVYYITHNIDAAKTIRTDRVWNGGSMGLNLMGNGMTAGEWDEGKCRPTHNEFQTGTGSRVIAGDGSGNSSHATHVGGTIIAAGNDPLAHGMANQAFLKSYDWNGDVGEMATEGAAGLLVSNHSYGQLAGWNGCDWYGDLSISTTLDYTFGLYTGTTGTWDDIAVNAPYYLICKAAGNDRGNNCGGSWRAFISGSWVTDPGGYTRPPADGQYDCISTYGNAKNAMIVAAVNDQLNYTTPASVTMSGFSSWGPTDDGRIKPDISANGVSLYSSEFTNDNAYSVKSGTSMATPSVTGSALLIQEHNKNVMGQFLRSATLKGLIIHTADETGANPGPDYAFGWGLMNTGRAVQHITDNNVTTVIREENLNNGQTYTFQVYTDGTQPLRTTICWTDPAGSPNAPVLNDRTPRLVNDLDVRVSNGTTFMPWVLDPNNPANAATAGDNIRDNVEQVLISTPTAGVYTITINHKGTLQGGSQKFSLIISTVNCFAAINTLPTTTYCAGQTINLQANTGTGLTYQWTLNGADIFGATNNNYNATLSGTYRVRVTRGGCTQTSLPVILTFNPPTVAGTLNGTATVCAGANVPLSLTGNTGTVVRWESSTDNFVTVNTINQTVTNLTVNAISTTTRFRAVVQSAPCAEANSNNVLITVTGFGGTTSAPATVCADNNTGTITLTGNSGGVLNWESSTDNFATVTNIPFTGNILTFTNVSMTTQFRARINNPSCPPAPSSATTITTIPQPDVTVSASPASPTCNLAPVNLSSVYTPAPPFDDCNRYTMQTIAAAPFSHTGTNVFGASVDDGISSAIPIGFNFNFFCNDFSQLKVSSNGFLSFLNSFNNGCCNGGVIPTADGIDNVISVCWTDCIVNAADNIKYQVTGTAPNRKFILSFGNNYRYFGETNNISAQVVLYETTNIVDVIAVNIPASSYVRTLGIENGNGTVGYTPAGRNAVAGWSDVNKTYRFIPFNSPANFSYAWSNAGNGFTATTPNATDNSPVMGNSTYRLTVAHAGTGCSKTYNIPYQIDPPTVAGTISANATVCATANSGTIPLTGNTGSVVRWESSTDNFTTVTTIPNITLTQSYTNLAQTTAYRAVVKSGACPAQNTNTVTITVDPATNAGTLSANQSVCITANAGTMTLTGFTGNIVRWESSTDNFTTVTNIPNTTPTQNFTNLLQTTQFRVVVKSGVCATLTSNSVQITVAPATVAGTLTASQTVCASANAGTMTLAGFTGNILRWESSTDNFTTVTNIPNTTPTQNFTNLLQTTQFRVVVKSGVCASVTSNSVQITVDPATVAGTLTASQTVCASANAGTMTLAGFTGNIVRWESSTDNFTTVTNIPNTTPTQNFTNLLQTTQFRVVVKSGVCATLTSNSVQITVDAPTIAGMLSADQTVCASANAGTMTLAGFTGNIVRWESSTDNFTTVTNIPNTTPTQNFTNLLQTTQFRVVVKSGVCATLTSNSVQITVDPATVAGTLSADQTVCASANSGTMTLAGFTGNIIRWESSTDNWATVNTIAFTGNALAYLNLNQTTAFRVIVRNGTCFTLSSNSVIITVNPITVAGTLGNDATVCAGNNNGFINLFGNTGNVVRWESSIDNWTTVNTINNTNITYNYTNLAQTTAYRAVVQSGVCAAQTTNVVTVTVNVPTVAGTLSANATYCIPNATGSLTLAGYQGNIVRWESSTDNWATVNIIVNNTPTLPYNNLLQTTAYRVVVQSGVCPVQTSNTVTLTVYPATVAGSLSGNAIVCFGNHTGSINLAGYTGTILRWESSTDNWATVNTIVNQISVYNYLNLTQSTAYRAVVESGNCGALTTNTVNITVAPQTVSGILSEPQTVCASGNSGIINLNTFTGNIMQWESSTDNFATVTVVPNTTPTQSFTNLIQSTAYRVLVQSGACPAQYSNVVTIQVDAPTVAGTLSNAMTVCQSGNTGTLNLTGHQGNIIRWESSTDNFVTVTVINNQIVSYTFNNLTQTTAYRVYVKSGVCEDLYSNNVTVQVDLPTVAGTLSQDMTLCQSNANGTITLTGYRGNIIRWESSTDNWATVTTINNNSNAYSFSNLPVSTRFRAVVQNGVCPVVNSNEVLIQVDPATIGGTLNGFANVCTGNNAGTLNLTGYQGNILRWESSDAIFSRNIVTINNTTPNQDYLNLTRTTWYRVVLKSGICAEQTSSWVNVNVTNPPVGGTLNGSRTVCGFTNSGSLRLTGNTGTLIYWESSPDNWVTITTLNGTGNTLTYANLTRTTSYRAVMSNGNICPNAYSSVATITVTPPTVAGTLSANQTVCNESNSGTLTLTGNVGLIQTWQSSINNGVSWQNFAAGNSFNYQNLTLTTRYRVIVRNSPCGNATSNAVTVTVRPATLAGTLTGNATYCTNTNAGFIRLTGNQGILLRWERSTDNFATVSTLPPAGPNLIYNNVSQTTQYRAVVQNGICSPKTSNAVTITILPTLNGGILTQNQTICDNQTAILALNGYQGQILGWEKSDDNWTTVFPIANTTATYTVMNLTASTSYRVKVGGNGCSAVYSNPLKITVQRSAVAGTLTGGQTPVCAGQNMGTLQLTGYSGTIVRWESSTDNWATVTTINNNAPTYLYLNLTQTTQFRAVIAGDPLCGTVNSSPVTVTVTPPTVAGMIDAPDYVCAGNSVTLNLIGYTGQIVKWEYSFDNWAHFVTSQNSEPSMTLFDLVGMVSFRVIVQNGVCPPETTQVKTVKIINKLDGGNVTAVTGSNSNCANPTGYLRLNNYTGNILHWEYSTNNWTTIQTIAHTLDTISYSRLPVTGQYRAVVGGNGCASVASSAVQYVSGLQVSLSAETGCGNLGYATAVPTGGLAPYRYFLFPNSGAMIADGVFAGLQAGVYRLTVLDTRNCFVQVMFTIEGVTPAPLITAAGSNAPTNGRIVWTETRPGNPSVVYEVRFRPVTNPNFTTVTVTNGTTLIVDTLQSGTTYETQVRASCLQFGTFTAWSVAQTFTTLSVKEATLPAHTTGTFTVYPNPTQESFTLQYNTEQPFKVILTDLTGKKVAEKALNPSGTYTFDVSELPAGIYIVRAWSGDRILFTEKVVVVR